MTRRACANHGAKRAIQREGQPMAFISHALARRMRRCFLVPLAMFVCASGAFAQTPQIGLDNNFADNQLVANTIRIIGFAITPNSTGYVEISVDAQNLGRAAYPLPRTDVPNSGFIMEIDTLNFSNGPRFVR